MTSTRMPVLFLSHGPGPAWMMNSSTQPWTKECDKNSKSAKYLRQMRETILSRYGNIKAILVVSAHWAESKFTVQKQSRPELHYDYHGFPDDVYHLDWTVSGSPDFADRTIELLDKAGIDCTVNTSRGLDHGVFMPLMLVFKEADIPVFQVSLKSNWDISAHLKLGETLSNLRDEGVLIVTSGQTTHNLDITTTSTSPPTWAQAFRNWVDDVITNEKYSADDRKKLLLASSQENYFSKAHPTMDHYLPIPVASASAGYNKGKLLYEEYVLGSLLISHYIFE